jgi:hypothetical protein
LGPGGVGKGVGAEAYTGLGFDDNETKITNPRIIENKTNHLINGL